jgi:hypothetical protein
VCGGFVPEASGAVTVAGRAFVACGAILVAARVVVVEKMELPLQLASGPPADGPNYSLFKDMFLKIGQI